MPFRGKLAYMRIPKSASTVVWLALVTCCRKNSDPRCCRKGVEIRDHRDGCRDLRRCNGTAVTGAAPFVVLREPAARFRSVAAHLRRVVTDEADVLHGLSDDALFAWLDSATRGCDSADCRVSRVNELYKDTHRVALWPQAFWAGPDPLVVCYDATHLVARVNAVFAKHCSTCLLDDAAAENVVAASTWAPDVDARRLFPEDAALWDAHCAPRDDGISREAWAGVRAPRAVPADPYAAVPAF